MQYRPDIDGLRSIAVLSVVLFHADITRLSGGFVGVDVFFVISGFLITKIIATAFIAEQFSIASFYERRARRILPALFVMITSCAVGSMFLLAPADRVLVGKSLLSAILFVSNIFFWWTTDYFNTSAEWSPLLHTWSLSVEEQFYIFYPPLLVAMLKIQREAAIIGLWILAAFSFALSIWWVATQQPQTAFYLSLARFWELTIGALLALKAFPAIRSRPLAEVCGIIGFALIIWSVLTFNKRTAFPGASALIPCLGTALIIHAGENIRTVATQILSLRPLTFMGLISYSLYLWHWPIFVFAKHYRFGTLSVYETAAAIVLSVAVATISWRFIERPFRKRSQVRRKVLLTAFFSIGATVAAGAVLTRYASNKIPTAMSQAIPGIEFYNTGTCFFGPDDPKARSWNADSCTIVRGKQAAYFLWGDSFAAHLAPGLVANQHALQGNIIQYTTSACPPIFGFEPPSNKDCQRFNEAAKEAIVKSNANTVILSARWVYYLYPDDQRFSMLQDTVSWIKKQGKKVILFGQSPNFKFQAPNIYFTATRSDTAEMTDVRRVTRRLKAYSQGAAFIDPLPKFCRGLKCKIIDTKGNFLFWDNGHLSLAGSALLIENMISQINGIALQPLVME